MFCVLDLDILKSSPLPLQTASLTLLLAARAWVILLASPFVVIPVWTGAVNTILQGVGSLDWKEEASSWITFQTVWSSHGVSKQEVTSTVCGSLPTTPEPTLGVWDRNQISSLGRARVGGRDHKGLEETWRVSMFIILKVVTLWWVWAYVKVYQIVYIKHMPCTLQWGCFFNSHGI